MSNVRVIPAHVDTPPVDAESAEFSRFVPEHLLGDFEVDVLQGEAIPTINDTIDFWAEMATCEHGLSRELCDGPMHYPADNPYDF